jgi:hypothetical protein
VVKYQFLFDRFCATRLSISSPSKARELNLHHGSEPAS